MWSLTIISVFASDCHGFHIKTLPGADSELTPYPLTRSVHDALPNPPLNGESEAPNGVKKGVRVTASSPMQMSSIPTHCSL